LLLYFGLKKVRLPQQDIFVLTGRAGRTYTFRESLCVNKGLYRFKWRMIFSKTALYFVQADTIKESLSIPVRVFLVVT
jgi:hypothetical protein